MRKQTSLSQVYGCQEVPQRYFLIEANRLLVDRRRIKNYEVYFFFIDKDGITPISYTSLIQYKIYNISSNEHRMLACKSVQAYVYQTNSLLSSLSFAYIKSNMGVDTRQVFSLPIFP